MTPSNINFLAVGVLSIPLCILAYTAITIPMPWYLVCNLGVIAGLLFNVCVKLFRGGVRLRNRSRHHAEPIDEVLDELDEVMGELLEEYERNGGWVEGLTSSVK